MIIPVLLYLALAVIFYISLLKKTHDPFNPIGVMTFVWFLTAGISATLFGANQEKWSLSTILLILLYGDIIGAIGLNGRTRFNTIILEKFQVSGTYRFVTRVIWTICALTVFGLLLSNGFRLNTSQITGFDLKTANRGYTATNQSLVGWILQYFPYTALNSVFELTYSGKEKHWKYNTAVVLVAIFFCWRVLYSRGTLIIIILGALFILNSKRRIKLFKVILMAIGFIGLLYYLMSIRLDVTSYVFTGNFNNRLLNSTYNYIAYNFQRFDALVKNGSSYAIGANTWFSVWKVLGLNTDTALSSVIETGAPVCIIGSFYDDVGTIGVIFYAVLIGILFKFLYRRMFRKPYTILMLAALQKSIFAMFFGNYLTQSFTISFSFLVTAAIIIISERTAIVMPRFVVNKDVKVRLRVSNKIIGDEFRYVI